MIFYVLNVALILAGCFTFYKVLLQKETFFPLNRFVLLSCLALSFSIPLIPIPQQWSFRKPNVEVTSFDNTVSPQVPAPVAKSTKPAQALATETTSKVSQSNEPSAFFKDVSVLNVLVWVYWLGVIIFAVNFIVQLCILLYRSYSKPVIIDGRYRIVELSGNQAPCSFGNNIFINPDKYDWDTYSQIILHEKIHIQQGHSYDIIFAELAIVFQWFNPFAWLYRKAMEDNLEFLTDNELLAHSDVEPASYKMSLVKVSAPHFPISLTTNYNQSILKKRLIMMNAKKSNVNSTWKYLFIIPLLLIFVSFLNEPVAYGKTNTATKNKEKFQLMEDEGSWFATIKNEKITFRFEFDGDEKSNNSTTFSLSDFKSLPRDKQGNFELSREPGIMAFIGRFEGNTGMGTYKFNSDASFISDLQKEGVTDTKPKDALVFFFINLKRDFVKMLKTEGYAKISKNDLIPLAALNVDGNFISSLRNAGLEDLSLQDLIPLKALGVDGAYVKDIKNAGYKNLSASNLITLKAQGIDGQFIKNARSSTTAQSKSSDDQMLALRNEKGPKGSKGSKTDYDEEMSDLGEMIAKKALNITAEYAKSFIQNGINVSDSELISMKSLGVTPEFIKSFATMGVKISNDDAIALKSLGITSDDYNEYKKIGFKSLNIEDVISAKATGTSPSYISNMKKKGHNYTTIDKYVEMKVLAVN